MDWNVIGVIGEIVSAIAVVASLLYLAKQIKIANTMNRTSTFREIVAQMVNQYNLMFGAENVELIVKGFKNYTLLSPVERLRFDHLMANFYQPIEDSWNSFKAGLLSEETMNNWAWYLKSVIFPYSGAREWWTRFKSGYGPGFQNWVGMVLEQTDTSEDPYGLKEYDVASA